MRNLFFGCYGEDVKKLQEKLESLGYADFVPTQFFGVKTHLALRKYQLDNNLPTTGIFGTTEASLMGISSVSNAERFFNVAMSFVGKDVTPKDAVDDDVACMETVDTIYKAYSGEYLNGNETTISTRKGLNTLMSHPKFRLINKPEKGCILIYATGTGNGRVANGHIFVSDGAGKLYSNTSSNGLFLQNYTDFTARYRYETVGGFKPYYFKLH